MSVIAQAMLAIVIERLASFVGLMPLDSVPSQGGSSANDGWVVIVAVIPLALAGCTLLIIWASKRIKRSR